MEEDEITSPSSFPARITNVFTGPRELFEDLSRFPVKTASWVVPLITFMCVGVFVVYSLYSNPELRQQIYDIQKAEMQKAVAEGKMPREQIDRKSTRLNSSHRT